MVFGCELGTPDAGGIDGTEPLGMTAKNGASGGFFVWVVVEQERGKNAAQWDSCGVYAK